jgi:ABC-type transport system involved in cytochrome bd biosynthesis fused ATPase/permease subunit
MTIAVAHRLSTLRSAARILVVDDGRVEGLGTHAELIASSPVYRRLWESQMTAPHASVVRESEPLDTADADRLVAGG